LQNHKIPGDTGAARRRSTRLATALVALLVLLVISGGWSLTIGPTPISVGDAVGSLIWQGETREDIVVSTIRFPRILAALFIGSTLAVAGALMQAVTNNPLASPDLLGVSAGASFAVVISIVLFDVQSISAFIWFAFAGAAASAAAVYAIGSIGRSGATPVKLALAGAVVSVFLVSIATSLLVFDNKAVDTIRMWSVGSLQGRDGSAIAAVAPYGALGLMAALLCAREVTTLSLGAQVARAVGQNTNLWRLCAGLAVVALAGSAVALAGPIGFVGLVVPHIVRFAVGVDYKWILPFAALTGALLVVLADGLQRWLTGIDVPVGVTLALVGAPFLIWLARSDAGRLA
jgi:iron complex transport system permease protein